MASEPTSSASTLHQTHQATPPLQQKSSSSSQTPSKVDVTIQPTSHLDPGAYVRGSLPIRIGHNVLIHPRVYLLSIHSPLSIGDGCIISEKSVLGGPAPTTTTTTTTTTSPATVTVTATAQPADLTHSSSTTTTIKDSNPRPTTIGNYVHIHPSATINAGATINSHAIIESNTVIGSNATIGSHSKVSAGLTITGNVPDWTVIWGSDGDQRRRGRRTQHVNVAGSSCAVIENERSKAMAGERDGTIVLLRSATTRSASARKR